MAKVGRKVGQSTKDKDNIFGNLEEYGVGYTWKTRKELSNSGVHRPKTACLHAGIEGVYSILLSSRYRGKDHGYTITYSGFCVKDKLNDGAHNVVVNSLYKNYNYNIPVRIIRGPHKESIYAPLSGYRYDGVYMVDKFWMLNNKICFHFKRGVHQASPPWFKVIPTRTDSPTDDSEESDKDICGYASFIRCQNRPIYNLKKEEYTFQSDSEKESRSLPQTYDNPENTSEYQSEDTRFPIENVSQEGSASLAEQRPILFQHEIPECPPPDSASVQPSPFVTVQTSSNEEPMNPEPPSEPAETLGLSNPLIGGMPVPFMKFETCKEEFSAGFVVIERLPGQEVVEVYNERVIYEEQATEVTEFVDSDDEDEDDCQVLEEQEVDFNYLKEFSNREIVTASELVGTMNLNTEEPPEGFYEVDVEDGPKYGLSRNLEVANEEQNDPSNFEDPNTLDVCSPLEMKHDADNQNIIEEIHVKQPLETETSISDLQIGNIVGGCVYFDANNDSTESKETILNNNLEIPACTLHDLQMLELRPEESNSPLNISTNDVEIIEDVDDSRPTVGEKPDSSSDLMIVNDKPQCDCKDDNCPLKAFDLFETIGFILKDFRFSNICKTLKTLSCWNLYVKILKGEQRDKRKAIMPRPSSDDNSEEGIGYISNVQYGESGTNIWNSLEQSDEVNSVQSTVRDEGNNSSTIQSNNNQEMITYTESDEEIPDRHTSSKIRALRIRAVEELCHVLLSQIQQVKASKEYGDALADMEDEALREDLEQKVMKKFSRLPCFVNEKKEVVLHHRKRKPNSLAVGSERGENQRAQEESQPGNKVRRMVQYRRNIRTEINRTRILQINKSCPPISEDKEDCNSAGECSDEGLHLTREIQVEDDCSLPQTFENEQEMSQSQADTSTEIITLSSDEHYEDISDEFDDDVLSTTNASETQCISRADESNIRLSESLDEGDVSSSSSSTSSSDADIENLESHTSNFMVSSPESASVFGLTCEEPCEDPLSMTDHVTSKKRKTQSQFQRTTPTKRSSSESVASPSPEHATDDNSDPIENLKGFTSEDISKSIEIKRLHKKIFLQHENEILFNFRVASTSSNIPNSNISASISTRPKSIRAKRKVQRFVDLI